MYICIYICMYIYIYIYIYINTYTHAASLYSAAPFLLTQLRDRRHRLHEGNASHGRDAQPEARGSRAARRVPGRRERTRGAGLIPCETEQRRCEGACMYIYKSISISI